MSGFGSTRTLALGLLAAFVVAGAAWLAVFGDLNAESGGLTQLPGPGGCVSVDGSGGFSDASKAGECAVGSALGLPTALVLSPDDRNAYVAAHREAVAVLDRGRDGALTQKPGLAGCHSSDGTAGGRRARLLREPARLSSDRACTRARALFGVAGVAMSPDGRNVYAAAADGLTVFERDRSSGALTQPPGRSGCVTRTGRTSGAPPGPPTCGAARALYGASFVAVSPDGRHVYAKSVDLVVLERDPATGALRQPPGRAGCIAADGRAADGAACATQPAVAEITGLTFSPDGRQAYAPAGVDTRAGLTVFDRDPATGGLTRKAGSAGCLGGGPDCTSVRGLGGAAAVALSPDGRSAYVVSFYGCAVAVLDRDPATGALAQKAGAAGSVGEHGERGACDNRAATERRGWAGGAIAVARDARSAFVTAHAGVAFFDRDTGSGALRYRGCASDDGEGSCEDARALNAPLAPVASADGRGLYVAVSGADAVAAFDRPAPAAPSP